MSIKDSNLSSKDQTCIRIEPRYFQLQESWFDDSLNPEVRDAILALTLEGKLPDWSVVLPPELRVSRKLAFRLNDRIVVIAGVGYVQVDGKFITARAPMSGAIAVEGTMIHDSFVSKLDLHKDPLGGLSPATLDLAIRRMSTAQAIAGFMAIIPKVIGHGIMRMPNHNDVAFLAYAYPARVLKPSTWQVESDEFLRGIENMARFLAVLHKRQFHGKLCHRIQGFANTLWTTDGNVIPVITGWGQHAGLISADLGTHDVTDLIEAAIYQAQNQRSIDQSKVIKRIAERVLRAYGQIHATCNDCPFDIEHNPLADWGGDLDTLIGKHGLVVRYLAQYY